MEIIATDEDWEKAEERYQDTVEEVQSIHTELARRTVKRRSSPWRDKNHSQWPRLRSILTSLCGEVE